MFIFISTVDEALYLLTSSLLRKEVNGYEYCSKMRKTKVSIEMILLRNITEYNHDTVIFEIVKEPN